MVVQPTILKDVPLPVKEAMVVGVPPLREPTSTACVWMPKVSTTYSLPSRETFDQGNCVALLKPLASPDLLVVRRVTPVPSALIFHRPLCLVLPPPPTIKLSMMKSRVVGKTARTLATANLAVE